jgi:hypothetical protein
MLGNVADTEAAVPDVLLATNTHLDQCGGQATTILLNCARFCRLPNRLLGFANSAVHTGALGLLT